ncbi:hypothetical protein HYY75_08180, partial [bacterium]|nr:hypothetical protein [bacterium]
MGFHLNFALRLDIVLGVIWGLCAWVIQNTGHHLEWKPFFLAGLVFIFITHLVVYYKIIIPLKKFSEIADNVADGDLAKSVDAIRSSELSDLQHSFTKITANLVEHQEEIGRYMQTIGDINKQLESQVEALSVLYSASKLMGTTLNLEALVRTLLSLTIDRLAITGSAVLLYNDSSDQVTVKDLTGFSPELFGKFKFFSDHKIVTETFSKENAWRPSESEINSLTSEFEADCISGMKLFFPMKIKDHFVGIFILGQKKNSFDFSSSEILLIQAIVGLATMAFNNARLYERSEATKNELDRKVFNLMTLQQSGKVLSSTLNLDQLIQISIDMFLETVYSNRGVLMLVGDDNNDKLEILASKGINNDELKELEKDPAEAWAITTLQKEKKPILAQELSSKSIYQSYLALDRPLPFAVYI